MRNLVFASLGLLWATSAGAQPVTATHQSFFVGGQYAGPTGKQVMHGQMFVEAWIPARVTHRYPLVLMHGLAQTATNWMTTPDGRQGWADWLVGQGWTVYMIDQPARGRSAWQPDIDGAVKSVPAEVIQKLFTAPEDGGSWPQAALHTQWPGGKRRGHIGDPVFDQFYASQVPSLGNMESEGLMWAAGAALLDRIGPAVLLTHSQAGAFGWLIADARPTLAKAIVAVEPVGPPFKDEVFKTGTERAWGLTTTPLAYEPPVTDASPLAFEQQEKPDAPGLAACWSQKAPARRLVNLSDIPVLVAMTEASYHAVYDHCTARFLTQAGVATDFVRLADRGIRGNAHMVMFEKNNLEVAALLGEWIDAHTR